MIRLKGEAENKRYWGTNINEGRKLRLGNYYQIYYIDHMIKNFWLNYLNWKYCNSIIIRDMSSAEVVD